MPPLCYGSVVTGTVSGASTTIEHNYQSATGQSGIAAGEGGFDITVKGATTLTGGAITSRAADKDNNRLTTASLSSTDLQNKQASQADASSLSAGYSGASTGATLAANAASNVAANAAANAGLPGSSSQSGSTQSVISAGRITITGAGNACAAATAGTRKVEAAIAANNVLVIRIESLR